MVLRRSTRQLASAPVQFVFGGYSRWRLAGTGLAALALLAGFVYYSQLSPTAGRSSALARDQRALEPELARLRAELEIERATRIALDQQLAELNHQLGELNRQVNFVNAQSDRASRE